MKIIFYSKRFIVGGMENAVYHLARLLRRDLNATITIVYEINDPATATMIKKFSKEFKTEYFINIKTNKIKEFSCDILINCEPNPCDLSYIRALHTIHWVHSRRVHSEYKDFVRGKLIICQSEWHRNELKNFGIDATAIKNPLDIALIKNLSKEPVQDAWTFKDRIVYLVVCRISPEKGLDRAIAFMKKEYNKSNILVIIGEPTTVNNRKIKERVEFQLGKRVVFLGEKTNPYPYMVEADYICSFADHETYGIVSEEAHILNKPVVFSKYETAKDQFITGFDSWASENNCCKNNAENVYDEKNNIDALEKWKHILKGLKIG